MTTKPSSWADVMAAFATDIGKDLPGIEQALAVLVGEPGDRALKLLHDERHTPLDDIARCFTPPIPLALLRAAVATHLRPQASVGAGQLGISDMIVPDLSVLPPIPNNSQWLKALRVGGDFNAPADTLMCAVRAGLARRHSVFTLPATLLKKMIDHATSMGISVPELYTTLQRISTIYTNGPMLWAAGVEGASMASSEQKDRLLAVLDEQLWAVLMAFRDQLIAWHKSWHDSLSGPAQVMTASVAIAGGRSEL